MRATDIPGQRKARGGSAHTDPRKLRATSNHDGWAVQAEVRPPRAAARRSSSALPSPRGDRAAPRSRDSPATLPPGVFSPHFLVPRAPLSEATGAPSGEGGLTSAAGAIRRLRPRILKRRARFQLSRPEAISSPSSPERGARRGRG